MTMCMFITLVSALIHLYSIGYMKDDRDYTKFFIYLNLFVFSMLLLVLADNLLLTFVGWEGVASAPTGWCRSGSSGTAASAGKKAFIYNRIGDVGFLLAIFLIFERTGTLQYDARLRPAHHLDGGVGWRRCAPAVPGRRRQVGPDPAVQLAARRHGGPDAGLRPHSRRHHGHGGGLSAVPDEPVAARSPDAAHVIAIIGAVTAFVAATIACAQQDIKKVLAFSTVSQIGYMILAVGIGRLHRRHLPHGHARLLQGAAVPRRRLGDPRLEDEQDLKTMGALRRYMPCTTVTFTIGWPGHRRHPAALGLLGQGRRAGQHLRPFQPLWVLGSVTAVLTAYYMSRLELWPSGASERWSRPGSAGARERLPAPRVAAGSCGSRSWSSAFFASSAGCSTCPGSTPSDFLELPGPGVRRTPLQRPVGGGAEWSLRLADIAAALIGVGLAVAAWRPRSTSPALEPAFLQRVWYWDDFYDTVIGRPAQRLAAVLRLGRRRPVHRRRRQRRRPAGQGHGHAARKLQTGYARNYALGIAIGLGAHHRLHADGRGGADGTLLPVPDRCSSCCRPRGGARPAQPRPARCTRSSTRWR